MKYIFTLIFIFLSITGFAQNPVIDRTFESGYIGNSTDDFYYSQDIQGVNDSLISIVINSKKTGTTVQYGVRYFLYKSDLTISRIDTLWDLTKNNVPLFPLNIFLTDEKYNKTYQLNYYSDTNSNDFFNIYELDGKFDKTVLAASFTVNGYKLVSDPFIYDSLIYICSVNSTSDSTSFRVFDFTGNQINRKDYFHGLFGELIGGIPLLQQSVLPHPGNDSLLIYPYYTYSPGIQLINRFTLDTAGYIMLSGSQAAQAFNQMGWLTKFTMGYSFSDTSFIMGGYCNQYRSFGDLRTDYTMFKIEMGYDRSILNLEEFGNDSVAERVNYYSRTNNADYFVGSSPFLFQGFEANEYRKLMLMKNSATFRDSLLFYGTSNHVGLSAMVDDNEDVFLLSRYSNAWTNDSIFTVITKIPNSLLVSVKEYNSTITSILVYPNPTRDQLRVDGVEIGEFYKVVSITGQLVLEGKLSESKTINVGSLKTGTYFLQLESQRAATYRANVFMKE